MSLPIILISALAGVLLGMFLPTITATALGMILVLGILITMFFMLGLTILVLPLSLIFFFLIPNSVITGFIIGLILILLAIARPRFGLFARIILTAVGISLLINSARGVYNKGMNDFFNFKVERFENNKKVSENTYRVRQDGLYKDLPSGENRRTVVKKVVIRNPREMVERLMSDE